MTDPAIIIDGAKLTVAWPEEEGRSMQKEVFVSGCFDLLHSGHVEFFQRAAAYGDLTWRLGSDKTVFDLKGRPPVNSEEERRFMVGSVSCVTRGDCIQRFRVPGLRAGIARPEAGHLCRQ